MRIQVTGEAPADSVSVTGGTQSAVIEVNNGAVWAVNGQTGNVTIDGVTDQINAGLAPYSADHTGTVDATAAIQAAINACQPGGVVYLPRGVYKTTSTIDLKNGVSLRGSHANMMTGPGMSGTEYQCYIQPAAGFTGTSVIQIIGDDDGVHPNISGEQRLVDLMIDGSQLGGSTIDGLYAKGNVQNVVLDGVTIRQMPNNGIVTASRNDGTYPYSWRLRHVMVDNCHANGILFTGNTDVTLDDVQVIGCWGQGFVLTNCTNGQAIGCRAEWNGSHGYHITGNWGDWTGSGGMQITGCQTDRNGQHGLLIDATGNTPILITGLQTRRDGRNGGAGGGNYAGIAVIGATVPVIIDGVTCYPGVDDDGGGSTNSPQYGARLSGASTVSLDNALLHANTAGLLDDGTNTAIVYGDTIITAAGATTATARTIHARTAVVNVKAAPYNAKGDGVTDDSAAIQAAINAGGITYFPPGVYLTGTLEAKLGMVLQGVTRSAYAYPVPSTQSSTLKLKNGTNGHLIHAATGINNVQIHDLAFDGNKANNTSGDIIHLDDATAQDTSWHIYDCYLDNSPHDGISVGTGRQAVKVNRTWIMRSANNGVTLNGADGGLDTVLIGLSGANGVYIGAWVQHLSNCDIWSSGANGVLCDNAHMVSLTNCGIDRHQQSGVVVQTGGSVSILGCLFHSNSQAANATYPHVSVGAGQVAVIGNTFATDGFANNPNYGVNITGGTVREWANNQVSGSFVTGFINPATSVNNFITGSLSLDGARQINVGASGSGATFAALRTNATDGLISGRATGDTVNRFSVTAGGSAAWGAGGAAAQDVTLARGAANRLDLSTADLRIATIGRGLQVAEGTNAKMGTAVLVGGTKVVTTTAVTANSRIYLTSNADGGTPGWLRVSTRTAGTSFTITSSSASDTSTVAWMIVEPA